MTDVATPADAPAESCALLVGVSAYEDPEFPPIRAARNSLNAMRSLLSDPALCAWPPEKIAVIANPLSATGLATSIADLAASTTGVMLLYYVGHGVLSARGELCLTVTSTRPDRPKISGLPWDTVADVLRSCPAHTRLAILDCCFAGQAIEALTGDGNAALADIAHVEGVYTLTATTRNRPAHVPSQARQDTACTSFTAELEGLVRSGLPGKPPRLTLSDIYPVLRQRLRAKGLPAPGQHGADAAQQFPFTANAAVVPGPEAQHIPPAPAEASTPPAGRPQPPQLDQSRYADIVADALRATHSIADESVQAPALAAVAEALAAADPDRAAGSPPMLNVSPSRSPMRTAGRRRLPRSWGHSQSPNPTGLNRSRSRSPTRARRHRRWRPWRRRWPRWTPTGPAGSPPMLNVSPSRSRTREGRRRCWPPSRMRWSASTPIVPNVWPALSPKRP